MELDLLIPKKVDVIGNIHTTLLGLTLYKETINPENNLDSYWIRGSFDSLFSIENFSAKMVNKSDLLSKKILDFPEYYQASIILDNDIPTIEYKDISNNHYIVIRKHENNLVLTIKQPTLKKLFEKLSIIESII